MKGVLKVKKNKMKKNKMNLQMFAEDGIQKEADFAEVQSIDFVNRFNGSLIKLREILGASRVMPMTIGTLIKTYTGGVTLESGDVAPGDLIPLSKVTRTLADTYEVGFKKYRKSVPGELIQQVGLDNAVVDTDDKMLKEVQKKTRTDMFNFLKTGTGTASAENFQGAMAEAWGAVETLFEDDGVETIIFANPLDVKDYLKDANITTQKEFGLNYLEGFTNVKVFTSTNIPKGEVYATAPENLVVAYVALTGGELGKAFNFTLDETGLIGITHFQDLQTLTYQSVVISGIKIFAERLDGVVKIEITPEPAGV